MIDTPLLDEESDQAKIFSLCDFVITFFFLIEFIFKVIANGLLWNFKDNSLSYLRVNWNLLDLVVLITSMFNILLPDSSNQTIKSMRILRAFRPLRVISRNVSLKLVVQALFKTLYALGNLLLVVSIIIIVFGLLGINLYAGKFYHCKNLSESLLRTIITK